MDQVIERAVASGLAGPLSRRGFLRLMGGASSAALLVACGPAAPSTPAATAPPIAARTQEAIVQPQAAPASGAPATAASPAPAAAPLAVRGEPKGKFTLAFHTTITPAWFDPQENGPIVTPYNFQYALHDALVKHMPGKQFAPSLAESYEIAPDFKSATFKLRPGIKFHDGTPVTGEDVKFSYEQYRGAGAALLKSKSEKIELPDSRTVKFSFKEPFLDFLLLYGSPATGAGWIVPKAYYEKVGKDAFKTAPIGAGPYRFVKQQAGVEVEFEAFPDYWRRTPLTKTIVMKGIPEGPTRVALLQTGEADVANSLPGELIETVRKDPKLRISAVNSASTWLELMALDRPDHPFKDPRVREAVSLAIDRQAINDAELAGLSPLEGSWIPADWPGALQRPAPPTDLAKAKQLLSDAGFANGFEVSALTPQPPFTTWGERVTTQLRGIGITTRVQTMERAVFFEKMAPGPNRLKGIILQFAASPGDAASRVREFAVTGGAFSGLSLPEIDDRMKAYDSSTDPAQRKKLLDEVQTQLLDQYLLIPLVRNVFIMGVGSRLANKPEDILGAIPQYIWPGPYEDLQVTA